MISQKRREDLRVSAEDQTAPGSEISAGGRGGRKFLQAEEAVQIWKHESVRPLFNAYRGRGSLGSWGLRL